MKSLPVRLSALTFAFALFAPTGSQAQITEIIDSTGDGLGNTLGGPVRVATDAVGNVFVGAGVSENVFKITPGGVITEIIDSTGDGVGNTLDNPGGVATDPAGNVFVAGAPSDNVFKITPGGVITEIIDSTGDGVGNTLDRPFGVATDAVGNVFVSGYDSDNAFKITPAGVITEIIDATGDGVGNALSGPLELVTDAAGNVFVAGGVSDNAFRITPGGVITEIIDASGDGAGNSLNDPYFVTADAAGNIHRFRTEGRLPTWRRSGDDLGVVRRRHPTSLGHPPEVHRRRCTVVLPVRRDRNGFHRLPVRCRSVDRRHRHLELVARGVPKSPQSGTGGVRVSVRHLVTEHALEHRQPLPESHRPHASLADVVEVSPPNAANPVQAGV